MATRKRTASAPGKASAKPAAEHGRQAPPPQAAVDDSPEAVVAECAIVGIGASAGGLEAFEQFFRACPADTGMAYVLVPHLDPSHESLLAEILQRTTAMPVVQASDQLRVEPNHVYIIPPNREMGILNRRLQLSLPEGARGQRLLINAFLISLAEDRAEWAIGIVFSGMANDGTLGLRAIFGAMGLSMCKVTPAREPSFASISRRPVRPLSRRSLRASSRWPRALQLRRRCREMARMSWSSMTTRPSCSS